MWVEKPVILVFCRSGFIEVGSRGLHAYRCMFCDRASRSIISRYAHHLTRLGVTIRVSGRKFIYPFGNVENTVRTCMKGRAARTKTTATLVRVEVF